jgi:hypothetical protein
MPKDIYVSDFGDDANDGLTADTPIRSWARYLQLKSGNDRINIRMGSEAVRLRITDEIEKREGKKKKKKGKGKKKD